MYFLYDIAKKFRDETWSSAHDPSDIGVKWQTNDSTFLRLERLDQGIDNNLWFDRRSSKRDKRGDREPDLVEKRSENVSWEKQRSFDFGRLVPDC